MSVRHRREWGDHIRLPDSPPTPTILFRWRGAHGLRFAYLNHLKGKWPPWGHHTGTQFPFSEGNRTSRSFCSAPVLAVNLGSPRSRLLGWEPSAQSHCSRGREQGSLGQRGCWKGWPAQGPVPDLEGQRASISETRSRLSHFPSMAAAEGIQASHRHPGHQARALQG